jgi:hypothetical protein
MTACEKIGLDAINANLFPAGEPGALSPFTDFVFGHAGNPRMNISKNKGPVDCRPGSALRMM